MQVKVKDDDGVHIRGKEEKEVWKSHPECLMNDKTKREAIVSSMCMEVGGNYVCTDRN